MDEKRTNDDVEKIMITIIRASGNETMSREEKTDLWASIKQDSALTVKSARLYWMKIAASVILILGMVLWQLKDNNHSKLKTLASATSTDFSKGETQIITGDNEIISLKGESLVSHSEDGVTIIQDSTGSRARDLYANGSAYNTLIVPYGRRSKLVLADGTQVWLNSGSKLIYPASFGTDKREVYLQGEAYFKVRHNAQQPFIVQSKDISVEVLGTEFNLSSYPDEKKSSAALIEGSIQLETDPGFWYGQKTDVLRPGERAEFDPSDNKLRISRGSMEEAISWKEGYLLLDRLPLTAIARKLSRYYNIPVTVDQGIKADETFSGRLVLQDDISEVMDILCTGSAYTYKESERRLTLKK